MKRIVGFILLLALLVACSSTGPAPEGTFEDDLESASTVLSDGPAVVVTDGTFSTNAAALIDGIEGTGDSVSWHHSDRPEAHRWDPKNYPVTANIDLGRVVDLGEIRYYVGNITEPAQATLTIAGKSNAAAPWTDLAKAKPGSTWNSWQSEVLSGQARYLKLSFEAIDQAFNVSEIEILGVEAATQPDVPGLTITENEAVVAPTFRS